MSPTFIIFFNFCINTQYVKFVTPLSRKSLSCLNERLWFKLLMSFKKLQLRFGRSTRHLSGAVTENGCVNFFSSVFVQTLHFNSYGEDILTRVWDGWWWWSKHKYCVWKLRTHLDQLWCLFHQTSYKISIKSVQDSGFKEWYLQRYKTIQ